MNKRNPSPVAQPARRSHLAQVIPIDRAARLRLRDAFLDFAARADRGEVTGLVYAALDHIGSIRPGILGQAQTNPALAHFAAAQLADLLLHPDELQIN